MSSIAEQYKELLLDLWQQRRENKSINQFSSERTRLWDLLTEAERSEVERWIEASLSEPQHVRT